MNFNKIALGFSLLSGLAMAGCDKRVEDDPLAGTWSNTECFGSSSMPADIESCSSELTFTNELEVELKAEWTSRAATETHPGCTTIKRVTGQEWSAEHATDTFTVTGNGTATMEREDCVKPEDDVAATATTSISIPNGDTKYTISGDVLSVQSGALKGTYNR
jgi:azurin